MNVLICTCWLVTLVTVFSATHVAADHIRPYKPNVCVDEKKKPMKEEEFAAFPVIGLRNCSAVVGREVCEYGISENGTLIKKVVTRNCCPGFSVSRNAGEECESVELHRPAPRKIRYTVHLSKTPEDGI